MFCRVVFFFLPCIRHNQLQKCDKCCQKCHCALHGSDQWGVKKINYKLKSNFCLCKEFWEALNIKVDWFLMLTCGFFKIKLERRCTHPRVSSQLPCFSLHWDLVWSLKTCLDPQWTGSSSATEQYLHLNQVGQTKRQTTVTEMLMKL